MEQPKHQPRPQCWPCIIDISCGALDRAIDDEAMKFEIMRDIAKAMVAGFNRDSDLPAVSTELFRLISERTGNPDPFKEVKEECNRIALPIANRLSGQILGIKDPESRLRAAALASIAGNTMDLGTSGHTFDLASFEEEYRSIVEDGLSIDDTRELLDLLGQAGTVIYLADNAGEIAFDKILLQVASNIGPSVTVAVKEGPISNDATLEDATFVGMQDIADVITTGTDHLGVNFKASSEEFIEALETSDLVISKGQSNLETLSYQSSRLSRPIAYVLRVKCRPIARTLETGLGDNVLKVVHPS